MEPNTPLYTSAVALPADSTITETKEIKVTRPGTCIKSR
jgi:hypothetical protein